MKKIENQRLLQTRIKTSVLILIALFALQSCTKKDLYQPVNQIAGQNENSNENGEGGENSHNAGQNCMNCHVPGGTGAEKIWKIAGTVYNEDGVTANKTATIKLYTGPDGTGVLKYTLTADALGNFYTSTNLDLSAGLYPVATGATTTKYMSSAVTDGACNSCHDGTNKGRVWTN